MKIEAKTISSSLEQQIKESVLSLVQGGTTPKMVSIVATDDTSAISYAQSKKKSAQKLGIDFEIINVEAVKNTTDVIILVNELNSNSAIHGILIEFPLWNTLDADAIQNSIHPLKDVDGLCAANLGMIMMGKEESCLLPATPQACIELASSYTSLEGKNVAIIGRGRTVGKPLAEMLINRNCTVTVCHSKTKNIKKTIADCEVVFVAIGRGQFVGENYLSNGQIVIDAGINYIEGKITGDVNPSVYPILQAYSTVPGGIGSITSVIIFRNLLRAFFLQMQEANAKKENVELKDNPSIWEYSLLGFYSATASTSPTPGGGAVSAVSASLGLSLIIMAIEITLAKDDNKELREAYEKIRLFAPLLNSCADEDIAVFNEYMAALRKPRKTDVEKLNRSVAIQAAGIAATKSPLYTGGLIDNILALVTDIAGLIKNDVISDIGAGVYLLKAALDAVLLNVLINTPHLKDEVLANQFIEERNSLLVSGANHFELSMALVNKKLSKDNESH